MIKKPIIFSFQMKDIEFFELDENENKQIINELHILEGLEYNIECKSPVNSYQKNPSLDENIKSFLNKEYKKIKLSLTTCSVNIKYDFAFKIKNKNVIFEVEKANKEKMLYDILKAHIYLKNDADIVVIIAPKNWVHAKGEYKLFDILKERLKLCSDYGMGNPKVLKNIILMGYTQYYKNKIHCRETNKEMNDLCKMHFN